MQKTFRLLQFLLLFEGIHRNQLLRSTTIQRKFATFLPLLNCQNDKKKIKFENLLEEPKS